MTVAIIVRENIDITEKLKKRLTEVLTELVVNDGATAFLFTNTCNFDTVCYDIVTKLKHKFSNIERHYHHGGYDYDVGYVDWLATFYDRVHFPQKGYPLPRELRDRIMIDKCDALVTYCDVNNPLQVSVQSHTATALAYAWKRKKRIINVFGNT